MHKCTQVDGILRDMVNITVRTDLTKIQRINLETCITVHMHQKESTEDLIKHKVKDPTDFEWLKQVRAEPKHKAYLRAFLVVVSNHNHRASSYCEA